MTDLLTRLQDASEDEGYLIKCALREARAQGWITEEKFKTAMHWAAVGAFVDAALTLVPEGWYCGMKQLGPKSLHGGQAAIWDCGELSQSKRLFTVDAATPALAPCIAALQAQQSKAEVA